VNPMVRWMSAVAGFVLVLTTGSGVAFGTESPPLQPARSGQPVWQIIVSSKCIAACQQYPEGVSAQLTLYDNETGIAEWTNLGIPPGLASHEIWDIGLWAIAPGSAGSSTFFLLDVNGTIPDVKRAFRIPLLDLGLPAAAGHYSTDRFVGVDAPPETSLEVQITKVPGAEVINLALGKSTTASNWLSDQPPSMAVDGNFFTFWNAGDFPPQWIEVDLGAPHAIGEISLSITQLPDGFTVHGVYGKPSPDASYTLLHEFAGFTLDLQVLRFTLPLAAPNIRFLRIETTQSPSWVAWREIGVYPAR